MNHTWKNGEKLSSGPDFGPNDPNLDPQNLFYGFYLY